MIPVYQTIFEPPHGNCLQAAIASLLECSLDGVPNFMLYGDKWNDVFCNFMAGFDLEPVTIPVTGCPIGWHPSGYYLVVGQLPHGKCLHNVIYKNGEFVHDPMPGGDGNLIGITEYMVFISRLSNPRNVQV
jgi:hypothetical protein